MPRGVILELPCHFEVPCLMHFRCLGAFIYLFIHNVLNLSLAFHWFSARALFGTARALQVAARACLFFLRRHRAASTQAFDFSHNVLNLSLAFHWFPARALFGPVRSKWPLELASFSFEVTVLLPPKHSTRLRSVLPHSFLLRSHYTASHCA